MITVSTLVRKFLLGTALLAARGMLVAVPAVSSAEVFISVGIAPPAAACVRAATLPGRGIPLDARLLGLR